MLVDTTPTTTRKRKPRLVRGRRMGGLTMTQKRAVEAIVARNQELKFAITNINFGTSTTGVLGDVTLIAQGDTDNTRDGDRLKLKRFFIRGVISTGDVTNILRIIWFQWGPNSVPTASSILLNGFSGSIDYTSQYNHDNRQEYVILYDTLFHMEGNGSAATAPYGPTSQNTFSYTLKPRWTELQYVGGTTVGTNHVYYFVISDSTVAPHPAFQVSCKVHYTDG